MPPIEDSCQQHPLPPLAPKSPASPQQQLFAFPVLLNIPNTSSRISRGISEFRLKQLFIDEFPHLKDFFAPAPAPRAVCIGAVRLRTDLHIAMVCEQARRYARNVSCIPFFMYMTGRGRVPSAVAAVAAVAVVVAAAEQHQDQQQEQNVIIASAKTHVANLLSFGLHCHHMTSAGIGALFRENKALPLRDFFPTHRVAVCNDAKKPPSVAKGVACEA